MTYPLIADWWRLFFYGSFNLSGAWAILEGPGGFMCKECLYIDIGGIHPLNPHTYMQHVAMWVKNNYISFVTHYQNTLSHRVCTRVVWKKGCLSIFFHVQKALRINIKRCNKTHLGWPNGIGLEPWSVLLLEVRGSIVPSTNLGGII